MMDRRSDVRIRVEHGSLLA